MSFSNSLIERFVARCCLPNVPSLSAIRRIVEILGPVGTVGLVCRKVAKQRRYKSALTKTTQSRATLKSHSAITPLRDETIVEYARTLLGGHDTIFGWPIDLSHERAWEYDAVEKKHWPSRHYTEAHLHGADTPRDAKIVWEVNRFVHLPALGQAAIIRGDKAFAWEVEQRMLSWINGNPYAHSVNWASALEVSIRLLSWTTTLLLLREAGFALCENTAIQQSIYEQSCYLEADLSTDKVIPSNHLIGEAAGLFIIASLWDYPEARAHAARARKVLEAEIIRQTFGDGVSREASGWYHQFVTHFFDLADRIAERHGKPFSARFRERLSRMKGYLDAITTPDGVVRYGDADDGFALWLAGNMSSWKDAIFGPEATPPLAHQGLYAESKHTAHRIGDSFLFMRAGEFGMGGDGSSSHAHDDLLSPIVWLKGMPIIVDPGTYVYNGNVEERAKYRDLNAHNAFVLKGATQSEQKFNFGWKRVRQEASVLKEQVKDGVRGIEASFGEWPSIHRSLMVLDPNPPSSASLEINDNFTPTATPYPGCEWRLHLHPRWKQEVMPPELDIANFHDEEGNLLMISSDTGFDAWTVENYDYSPMYGVAMRAPMFRAYRSTPEGTQHLRIALMTKELLDETFGAS